MTLEEKVGQLLLYKTTASKSCNEDFLYHLVETGKVGTLILDQYTIDDYIRIATNCNAISNQPLWYATTENISLNNQFSDAVSFPTAATIGAINDQKIHQEIQNLYVDQCRALGIHLSLGNSISSSTNSINQTDWMSATQDYNLVNQRIRSLFKHRILSGGQLTVDLSKEKPSSYLFNEEFLIPFRSFSKSGLAAVSVGSQSAIQASFPFFQSALTKNYLHYGVGFDGFLFSSVSNIEEIESLLVQGTDILVVENDDIELMYEKVLRLLESGIWTVEQLNNKVEKILKAKSWTQRHQSKNKSLNRQKIEHLLRYPHFDTYVNSCYQKSVALIKNMNLPFENVHQQKYQILHFDDVAYPNFIDRVQKYSTIQVSTISTQKQSSILKNTTARLYDTSNSKSLSKVLKKGYSKIFILDRDLNQSNKDILQSVNKLATKEDITIINFGHPDHLRLIESANIIQIIEQNKVTETFAAELLFGGQTATGQLTIDISDDLKKGASIQTPITRLNFSEPEIMGIDTEKLEGISTIVERAIRKKAIPGCQILVAKKGSVIYNQSFGYHTYDKKIPVQNDDLYDLASLTKTTATTLATMKLFEQDRLSLERNMEQCFGEKCGKRLKHTKIKNLLLHTSRLQANMPIYGFIHRNGVYKNQCNSYFCGQKRNNYRTKIADHFYINDNLKSSLLDKVLGLKLQRTRKYRYSDVNFNLLQQIIEDETKLPLDQYVYQHFYTPLHLKKCLYKPTTRYYKTKIVPTAQDRNWRNQLLHGFVHDESAALLGGVGGNAGLFSNAEDLAVLYQMLLNGGSYGGTQFLQSETIDVFTKKQAGSRRGLGFDKPRKTKYPSYSSKASKNTYGHTGFTGTAVWVDPDEELVYIFLSNRIHPKPNNTKLFKLKTRRKIHDVVYKALNTFEVKLPTYADQL